MIKSVSIIDDNYDNANEEHHKLLFEILDDIKGLKKGKIVPTTHLQEYVTKNGYGDLVIMSIETYEKMLEERKIDDAIAQSEAEYEVNGVLLDAKEALKELRRKNFG